MSETADLQSVLGHIHIAHQVTSIRVSTVCALSLYEDDQSRKDVECAFGRWLHKDCTDDCFVDDEGKERLCLIRLNPFCKYS